MLLSELAQFTGHPIKQENIFDDFIIIQFQEKVLLDRSLMSDSWSCDHSQNVLYQIISVAGGQLLVQYLSILTNSFFPLIKGLKSQKKILSVRKTGRIINIYRFFAILNPKMKILALRNISAPNMSNCSPFLGLIVWFGLLKSVITLVGSDFLMLTRL